MTTKPHARRYPFAVFFKADTDATGAAGAADAEPKTLAEAKTALADLRGKLATAETDKAQALKDLAAARQEAADHKAEAEKVAGQFAALEKTAEEQKSKLEAAEKNVSQLTLERDAAQGKLTKAEENVGRLEKLCGVRGIDPKSAVTSLDNPADRVTSASFDARYKAAKSDPERKTILAELEKAAAEGRLD